MDTKEVKEKKERPSKLRQLGELGDLGNRRRKYLYTILKCMGQEIGKEKVPISLVKIISGYSDDFLHDQIVKHDQQLISDMKDYQLFLTYAKGNGTFNGRIPRNAQKKKKKFGYYFSFNNHNNSIGAETKYYDTRKVDQDNIRLCPSHWASFVLANDCNRLKRARRISAACRSDKCDFGYGSCHMKCEFLFPSNSGHYVLAGCQTIVKAPSDIEKEW
jgi:hypothetical protein